jgi:arsenate reductase
MIKTTIYHNNSCSKSRASLALLESNNLEITQINYLDIPPTVTELDNILEMLNLEPIELIRTGEKLFKKLSLNKSDQKSRQDWLEIMATNPILIERPIIVINGKAVIGRPPENILKLI